MLEERVHLLETPDAAENLMPVLGPLLIGFLVSSNETVQTGDLVPYFRTTFRGNGWTLSVADKIL